MQVTESTHPMPCDTGNFQDSMSWVTPFGSSGDADKAPWVLSQGLDLALTSYQGSAGSPPCAAAPPWRSPLHRTPPSRGARSGTRTPSLSAASPSQRHRCRCSQKYRCFWRGNKETKLSSGSRGKAGFAVSALPSALPSLLSSLLNRDYLVPSLFSITPPHGYCYYFRKSLIIQQQQNWVLGRLS